MTERPPRRGGNDRGKGHGKGHGGKPFGSRDRGGPPRRDAQQQRPPRRPRRTPLDPARQAAFDVLRAVSERDSYANLALPAILAERGINSRDAAFATELTYGTCRTRGLLDAVGYPESPKPQSPWAQRLMKAHVNAVENLVIFAPLVLLANALGVTGPAIATSAVVYFWARLVHAVSYTLAIPWVRTLSFTVGFLSQACIAWQLLRH